MRKYHSSTRPTVNMARTVGGGCWLVGCWWIFRGQSVRASKYCQKFHLYNNQMASFNEMFNMSANTIVII